MAMVAVAQQYCSRARPRRREVGRNQQKKKEIKPCEACKFEHHPLTFDQCEIINDYGKNYPQLVKACELASLPPPPPLPVKPPPTNRNKKKKKYNQPCNRCQLYESYSAILNYHRLFRDGENPNLLILPPKEPPFESFLLLIESKRRSSREEGFSSLVNAFVYEPRHHFVDANFLTIVTDYCLPRLTSKKKGSSNFSKKEIRLAVRLISLVAINLVNLDYSYEVYELCVPILSDALFSFNYPWDTVVEILDCLAIVGFLGSNYPGEKEKVMRVISEFLIRADDDQNTHRTQLVTASAITAWSFLLSTIKFNTWNLSKRHWTGCVSCFSQLLEKNKKEEEDSESVVVAAATALALISRFNFLNGFSNSDELSHIIKLKFMKRFLGEEGFTNHMEQNQNLKGLLRATNEESDDLDYDEPEREEAMVKFYPSKIETDNSDPLRFASGREKKIRKRMTKSPSSLLNKARSKLLNKQRQFRNNVIYYDNQSDD